MPNSYDISAQMFNPYMNGMMPYPNTAINLNPNFPNLDFTSDEAGENIKVCVRIRPMNLMEQGRGDGRCVEYINTGSLAFKNKNINRNYSFNVVFGEGATQEDLFYTCSINVIIIK
jgi:hypothetical protein